MLAANRDGKKPLKSAGGAAFVAAICATAIGLGLACIRDLPPDQPPPRVPRCGDGYVDLAAGEQCDPGPGFQDAGVGGCSSTCQVECPGLVLPYNLHCYELAAPDQNTLTPGARGRCSGLPGNAHVVTFASETEFDDVARYVSATDAGPFWVGLWRAPDFYNSVVDYEPGWSPECPGCYAHTEDAGAPLPRTAYASDGGQPGCVGASSDLSRASWQAISCNLPIALRVVCEREPLGLHWKECEAGICIELAATHPTKRYVYRAVPALSADAEQDCVRLGGSLVVLESREEREQLWRELSRLPLSQPRLWIGLSPGGGSSADSGGGAGAAFWVWDDGTRTDAPDAHPSPWAIGEPAMTSRAMLVYETQRPIDNTLAETDGTAVALPYVCQIVTPDAGE
jgi:hypothetical protein